MFSSMTEEKLKRTIIGMAIAGTLVIVLLLGVLIYQFVSMGIKNWQLNSLQTQIAEYEQKIETLGEQLAIYGTDKEKENLAREHGYVYPDDKTVEDLLKQ
ncbi:MAG: hypothetical protein IKC91_01005 [Clostridia bacterium]|nr:hypothetical protein [Clostridia bacterium]